MHSVGGVDGCVWVVMRYDAVSRYGIFTVKITETDIAGKITNNQNR